MWRSFADLATLQAADAAFDSLGSASTIADIVAANEVYGKALDDVVSSAKDVASISTEPIEDAYAHLDAAIDDIAGDATIAEALISIFDELDAVDRAYEEAFSGVICP